MVRSAHPTFSLLGGALVARQRTVHMQGRRGIRPRKGAELRSAPAKNALRMSHGFSHIFQARDQLM